MPVTYIGYRFDIVQPSSRCLVVNYSNVSYGISFFQHLPQSLQVGCDYPLVAKTDAFYTIYCAAISEMRAP